MRGRLRDASARDRAVRDYKRFEKTRRRWKPSSVNQALLALDSFFRTRPAGGHTVRREVLPAVAPKALEPVEGVWSDGAPWQDPGGWC